MRVFLFACGVAAASTVVACGGGTPPPKDSDEAIASSTTKADHPPADDATDAGSPVGDPLGSAGPSKKPGPTPAPPSTPANDSSLAASAGAADDPWMASHQMAPKDVLHGTRPVQAKAQACFKAGVKRDPSTSGEVKIKFVVTNEGAVRVWRDEGSSMSDAEVIQCIGEVVKAVKFAKQKSPGDAWGVYSVHFGS